MLPFGVAVPGPLHRKAACETSASSVAAAGSRSRAASILSGVQPNRLEALGPQKAWYTASLAAGTVMTSAVVTAALHQQRSKESRIASRGQRRYTRVAASAAAAAADTATAIDRDVAIVGAGPAGTLLAFLLSERHGLSVCLIDERASAPWPNNYGVWQEEWDALASKLQLDLQDCLKAKWPVTDTYFGGSWDRPVEERLRLDRPYGQVDRGALKAKLQTSKVEVIEERLDATTVALNIMAGDGIKHTTSGSELTFKSGLRRNAKVVIDCTGSESKLTIRRDPAGQSESPEAGFQIAYGMECIVEGHTHYAQEAMTLFDYRTDHLRKVPGWEETASKSPTFMYAMPFGQAENGGVKIFFEETSLVARPGVSFEECKRRLYARLEHLGVKVRPNSISEEEYCYIPMGGPLPIPGQRIVAYGGAAAMVHPSTGYQLCRMMAGSKEVADAIAASLSSKGAFNPDAAAAAAYDAVWSPQNIAQRDFAVFGGEFLMELDVEGLRGWFGGFFRLPEPLWAGFLAGWPTLPGNENHESWFRRIAFGLQLVTKLPWPIILKLVGGIASFSIGYGPRLLRSVTPLFGDPPSYKFELPKGVVGDEAAKKEARAMMAAKAEKQKHEGESMVGWGYR